MTDRFVVMKGAWNNEPVDYGTPDGYLDDAKSWLEAYVKEYLDKYHPGRPAFEMDDSFRQYFKSYLDKHAKEQYVENIDGSYDYIRLNNLCIAAVADFLQV